MNEPNMGTLLMQCFSLLCFGDISIIVRCEFIIKKIKVPLFLCQVCECLRIHFYKVIVRVVGSF
jgi:hypothetical protein